MSNSNSVNDCPVCNNPILDEAYYYGLTICRGCANLLSKSFPDLNSSELRKLSNFFAFFSGLKYGIERADHRRQLRESRKALAKFDS